MSNSFSTYENIVEQICRFFIAVDNRAWNTVLNIFAEKVLLDYSSMGGGAPALLAPGQIVESWKGLLPGFDATHHQLGNFQVAVSGEQAKAFCYGTASHYFAGESPGKLWVVIGSYDIGLRLVGESWRIEAFKFNLKFIDGNTDLPRLAQERAKGK